MLTVSGSGQNKYLRTYRKWRICGVVRVVVGTAPAIHDTLYVPAAIKVGVDADSV